MASRRISPTGRAADDAPLHNFRIVVVASSIGALVESAGGFLCDRVREGWDVIVRCGPGDPRPLNILGVAHHTSEPVEDAASVIGGFPRGATLAVDADLLAGDACVRLALGRLAGHGLGAVTVWGAPAQAEMGHRMEPTPHTLSPAARAFKASALRAAELDPVADPVESLYRLRSGSFRRLYSV